MNRPTVRPKVRSDVALIPGYHSPQLDVAVRLNTNEAPEPPPVDFGRRLGELLANADWNRYPDREATRLRTRIAEVEGTTADRVLRPTAPTRCCSAWPSPSAVRAGGRSRLNRRTRCTAISAG